MLIGQFDNGNEYYSNGNWIEPNGYYATGDGFECLIDRQTPSVGYSTINGQLNGVLNRLTLGLNSVVGQDYEIDPGINGQNIPFNETSYFGAPIVDDPSNPITIYQGRKNVFKAANGHLAPKKNSTWWEVKSNFANLYNQGYSWQAIYRMAIAPSDNNTMYVSSYSYPLSFVSKGSRLAKTNNLNVQGIATWTDITPSIISTNELAISGIAVSSSNPDEVWVSVSGFNPGYKVFYTSNGGSTWTTITTSGLPNMPVNCIAYQPGSNDIIYIGTDVGVYYKDASMSTWLDYNPNLPNVIVNWLDINTCTQKIQAATFGRGLWEYDLAGPSITKPLQINGNVTWNNNYKNFGGDIFIANGSTLTITNTTVNMGKNIKIIVEDGGKLVVSTGGKITNECGGMWKGIELWGDKNASQLTSGAQGIVEVKNGGIIENAINAISTIKTDANGNYDWSRTGGIVKCDNAVFRNNQRAVEFLSYHNYVNSPANQTANLSHFNYCTFETTALLNDNTLMPTAFVTMFETDGIEFKGNTFKNTDLTDYNQYQRGNGIYSIDASYNITRGCNVITNNECVGTRNTFENLAFAVRPASIIHPAFVKVDGNTFTNNYEGVVLEGTYGNSILRNTFELNDGNLYSAIGMFTVDAYSYNAEENTFLNNTESNIPHYGLAAHRTGFDGGSIYRNSFSKFYSCTQMQKANDALSLDCNTYTQTNNSKYDWAVTSGYVGKQGDYLLGDLRKNTFHSGVNGSGESQVYHHTLGNPSLLYDALTNYNPTDISSPEVSVFTNNGTNSCNSTIGSENNPSGKMAQSNTYNNQRIALLDSVNAGNAPSLYSLITNTANNSSTVRSGLLAASPYLSDAVLIAAINRSPLLDTAHIRDIVIANSPVSAIVMDTINALNLTSTYITPINAAQTGGATPVKKAQQKISFLLVKKQALFNSAMRQYIDSSFTDSVIIALQSRGYDLGAKQALIPLVMGSDTALARQCVNFVNDYADSLYAISSSNEEVPALYAFANFYSMMIPVSVRAGSIFALDSAEMVEVENIASTEYPIATQAQNILMLVNGAFYDRVPEAIGSGNSRESKQRIFSAKDTEKQNLFSVYPNPLNNSATISYTIPFTCAKAEVVVYDLTGKRIISLPIEQKGSGDLQFKSSIIGKGVYMFTLIIDNAVMDYKKVIIIEE